MTGQATFSLADEDLAAVSLDWAFLAAALSPEPLLLLESEVEEDSLDDLSLSLAAGVGVLEPFTRSAARR
jgi:hypothetical protein